MKFLLTLLLLPGLAGAAENAQYESCYANWDGSSLTVGNRHVERRWQLSAGALHATLFRDLDTSAIWLEKRPANPAPASKNGFVFSSHSGKASPVEAGSLIVELKSPATPSQSYRFQIFPEARGILVQSAANTLDDLDLAMEHARLTQVTLHDQTDGHNQLVFENEWLLQTNEKPLHLEGDLFIAENTLTHAGLIFLKLAPLPAARPIHAEWDLEASLHGRMTHVLLAENDGYESVVLAYTGGRPGRTEALQTFQRQLRVYEPHRDGMFLSNTWGDRSRDLRINSDFMKAEIEAGAKLGVDVIQIDDGWQKGFTINSARGTGGVWTGYWNQDPNFWQPDPKRFPQGLRPLVEQAASHGMKFGLWFSPDSSNDFANWQRDAGKLLALHHDEGIDYFKIDGIKAVTKTGEQNLHRMVDEVLAKSNGSVTFDLDVTAETRPGYFGMPRTGPLFVENRYSDFHGYWPHQTLRNLWMLAQYVDPLRLRMEVLNNTRNTQKYEGDPLAPSQYAPDFLFASVMFSNPLGWFETSNLPQPYVASMSKLVATWKQQRAELFSDTILPIGEAPDGVNWTGFAAFSHDRASGYLLIFRGLNDAAEWDQPLPVFSAAHFRIEPLAGDGEIQLAAGRLHVRVPKPRGFVWVKLNARP
jgi:alpha-galactosidase